MWKKINTGVAVIIIAICLVVFSTTLTRAVWYTPSESELSVPVPTTAPLSAGAPTPGQWPVTLRVPSLAIVAHVQSVGISKKGNMAVPTNYTDVAWYKGGSAPGQLGSAVFDGHVDNGFGMDGVFKHLGEIKAGDKIITTSKEGKTYTYAVEKTENYPYTSVPDETIFNASDAARLNIITCEGAWVAGEKTYDHRLVVYAKLVSTE